MLTVAISTCEKHKAYLPRALHSARGADEILVIDDGWECQLEGVRYYGRDFTGSVKDSRLIAINKAKGDWIIHLDADDELIYLPRDLTGDWCFASLLALIDEDSQVVGARDCRFMPRDLAGAVQLCRENPTLPTPMKAAFRLEWVRQQGLTWYEWPSTTYAEDVATCLEYLNHDPEITMTGAFYGYRARDFETPAEIEGRRLFEADLEEYLS